MPHYLLSIQVGDIQVHSSFSFTLSLITKGSVLLIAKPLWLIVSSSFILLLITSTVSQQPQSIQNQVNANAFYLGQCWEGLACVFLNTAIFLTNMLWLLLTMVTY